jgi:hypothetical protein
MHDRAVVRVAVNGGNSCIAWDCRRRDSREGRCGSDERVAKHVFSPMLLSGFPFQEVFAVR